MTGIRRGWIHLASGAGVGRIFGFASNLLVSRWLGPAELGLFNLVLTSVQTTDTLVRCGGDYSLNYKLGAHPESLQTQHGARLARGFAQICSLATFFICLITLVWVLFFDGLLPSNSETSTCFIFSCLLILMMASEGTSAAAWEILLVSRRTTPLAMKQGLFYPLRLCLSAIGALIAGLVGALSGWTIASLLQAIWLKIVLGALWRPLSIFPLLRQQIIMLLKNGLPFYGANLLASAIFYPLLLYVASSSGLADIGYLRAGQILQQLFAFLPSTMVPLLFLKLRTQPTFSDQVSLIETPTRVVWFILLQLLFLYCLTDRFLIQILFGHGFSSAVLPTRLLLLTSIFECIGQLLLQPILATGQTWRYGLWQNFSAILSATLGFFLIPYGGLSAYLSIRLVYVVLPFIAFGLPVFKQLTHPSKMLCLILFTFITMILFIFQISTGTVPAFNPYYFISSSLIILLIYLKDLSFIFRLFRTEV